MGILTDTINDLDAITEEGVKSGSLNKYKVKDALKTYLGLCGKLAYTDPETIMRFQKILGRAVIVHAHQTSPIYQGKIDKASLSSPDCLSETVGKFLVGKTDLLDKKSWYTNIFQFFDNRTSGSTGDPFVYRIWKDAYEMIEGPRHYKMVLDEFGITEPNSLYIDTGLAVKMREVEFGNITVKVADKKDFDNPFAAMVASHGSPGSDYHHIAFDSSAYLNVTEYCRFVVDFIQKNNINVLTASGGFFELFTTFLISDDSAVFPKLTDLMSNTGDKVNPETLNFLKETGVTKNWCDHMRCWDGGASFFTCSHGTYHTQDELSYVYATEDGRMATVDFFSYPSPFINYVNGDYCSVGSDWKKCDCGRWHRDFQFHNRKPRQYANANGGFYDTDDVVKTLLGKWKLGFFSVHDGSVTIEDSLLDEEEKRDIVLEMAKIYVMVNYFTNPHLSARVTSMSINAVDNSFCNNQCPTDTAYCGYNTKYSNPGFGNQQSYQYTCFGVF